jgi:hypothetical protein
VTLGSIDLDWTESGNSNREAQNEDTMFTYNLLYHPLTYRS